MISIPHRCIFVKVPKTAGTSIAVVLRAANVGKPHRDLREIRSALASIPAGPAFYESAFKFGFVRNPWDRVVSMYHRKERGRKDAPADFTDFCEWIEKASDTCIHPSPKQNQRDWLTDDSDKIAVDFIGRFESLRDGFATICENIGAPNLKLPHENNNARAKRKHYTEYYTPALRDLIGEKFAVDVETFGYKFDA